MKNLTTILGIAVFSLSLFACSQKEGNSPIEAPQNNIVTASCEIEIDNVDTNGPSKVKALGDSGGGVYRPKVYVTYDLNREKVISWMTDDNVYSLIYERKGLTRLQVNNMVDEKLRQAQADRVKYNGSLVNCIDQCNDKYPKGQGRGECKFYCILDWLKDVLKILVSTTIRDNEATVQPLV